jgi:TolB-like protein
LEVDIRGAGNKVVYLFGDYSLDTVRRQLLCGTNPVAVEPQVFDILEFLICNRDRVVSKDDLFTAVWSGRIVSESALTSRLTAVRHAVGDSGEEQRLIRTIRRKGFRFVGVVHEGQAAGKGLVTPALPLPDKPSIAVLPFDNLSGDREQEYFADGIVEELITALSRMRWLFVIARNSSFAYKGRAIDVKQVGRELGVRYLLEGSVRKAGNRVRISGQLVDTAIGAHLWADRFDGALEDIFDLQDQVTASVVGTIAPRLEQAEIERTSRKPTESLDAYDYYLRGLAGVHQWTKDGNEEALGHLYRAIELDRNFASAYGMAARCYSQRKTSGWVRDRAWEIAETERLARRAAELGKDDALALCTAGMALNFVVGDANDGAALIDRAIALNPNLAWAWLFGGWAKMWVGESDAAIERIIRAMRLSPTDPHSFSMYTAMAGAHFYAGRFIEAVSWGERALRERPNYIHPMLVTAASFALAGRLQDAEKTLAKVRTLDPELRVSNLGRYLNDRSKVFSKWEEGLRLAGLPE